MRYYFEERTNKVFRGRRRTTIVTTLNEDITSQPAKHVYEGKKQKALVKDCKTSCKLTSFRCDWKEKRQQRRRRKNGALGVHDVYRAKVGEFLFSFLCSLQLQ